MARYGQAFKDRVVARLLPPESASVDDVAREVGVGGQTLERGRPSATAIRIAAMVGPNVGRQALRRRAERIGGMMTILKSIGTATAPMS